MNQQVMDEALLKAQTLVEALPYIRKFNRKIVVIKYGGSAMKSDDLKNSVIEDATLLKLVGFKPIIVHGGGKEISEWVKKTGGESRFVNGFRVTDEETMTVAEMVLNRINKELVSLIGRLHYRTSYGQNGLTHSMEVAYLTGIMAGELGLDVNLARRAGLLHDIGKAVDFELEGSHVELGAQLAKKYGENDVVLNSIESHHGDVEARYVIAHLVAAADALSAARPGARSETLETYVKRIEQLETLAKSFDGVSQAYAMQSGREVRVMVIPEKVSDAEAIRMAQVLRTKIEQEVTYPGQIKVSVIREYRAVETAK